MLEIRYFSDDDWADTWKILEPVFRAGTTYPYSPTIDEDEAYQIWINNPAHTYVAVDSNLGILGTYYLKPNQPDLGSHVCNCGYVVSPQARGRGTATAMCKHSQQEAVKLGYTAMQFNLVVAVNEVAVRLWQKLGFEIVGTLPDAFRHADQGLVDAHVMYKRLVFPTVTS
ncbi:N-acetyltransferase family protein [Crateriforma spongiae]|uniref:GNAT family N-acetyltransferase n=1 Tax=Crateriforma spongiae TaxID=2724528 RepID=UPI0039AEB158